MNQQQPAPPKEVRMTFVSAPRGGRLVYCTVGGQYLGTIEFDAANPEVLQVLSAGLQQYAAQQAGGIQIAGANAVPGLRAA